MNRFALALFPLFIAASSTAQVTQRLNLGPGGVQANAFVFLPPPRDALSADGRCACFVTTASNLVAGDTNATFDVLVRDRIAGTTELASISSAGVQGNSDSGIDGVAISADGRYVVFSSSATTLIAGDTNGVQDIYLRDRVSGTTQRVSLDSAGAQANGFSMNPSLSPDGRFVVFASGATNLVAGDTNGETDIFRRDLQTGLVERVSVAPGGVQGNGDSFDPDLTPDGRFVVFSSYAVNFVAGSFGAFSQIYVRDMQTGAIECASLAAPGVPGDFFSFHASISADGRFVCFESGAFNLVPGDANGVTDIVVRDLLIGLNVPVSVNLVGSTGAGTSSASAISDDGRFVVFHSTAADLVAGDTNTTADIFVHDLVSSTTERVNLNSAGSQSAGFVQAGAISADGRFVLFSSSATNLVAGDTNNFTDAFVRDRRAAGFESLCSPGSGGVIACPCGNPPAGAERGCDNSSATGGAVLSASGAAYLAIDNLVFTTSGQRPQGTSILLQGSAAVPGGAVFGQGVRCAGGALKRLYIKQAAGGSITAPELGIGDLQVSARSAALGDPIAAGQTRWYLVYYRDPNVLGGCSAASTFNATQTGAVTWFP